MLKLLSIYSLNHIDRNNLAAAKITNMTKGDRIVIWTFNVSTNQHSTEIGLTDVQFQTCLSILYVGYLTAQVASNMVLHRVAHPALYISFWVLIWGAVSTVTGTVTNYGGLLACRLFRMYLSLCFFSNLIQLCSAVGFLECPYFAGCNCEWTCLDLPLYFLILSLRPIVSMVH